VSPSLRSRSRSAGPDLAGSELEVTRTDYPRTVLKRHIEQGPVHGGVDVDVAAVLHGHFDRGLGSVPARSRLNFPSSLEPPGSHDVMSIPHTEAHIIGPSVDSTAGCRSRISSRSNQHGPPKRDCRNSRSCMVVPLAL